MIESAAVSSSPALLERLHADMLDVGCYAFGSNRSLASLRLRGSCKRSTRAAASRHASNRRADRTNT
jgi:hypothetical protein